MTKKSVLVVEDDDDFATLISLGLTKLGHEVIQCRTAKAAKQELAERAFALIVVDGLLPDGNGVRLISDIREKDKKVPVAFLSSFFDDESNRRRLHELNVAHMYNKRNLDIRRCIKDLHALLEPPKAE